MDNNFGLFYKRHMTFKTWIQEFSLDICICLTVFAILAYFFSLLWETI